MRAMRSLIVFALAGQLRLKVGDLADGVLVQQFLEARLEARQVVGLQRVEHGAVLGGRRDAGIDLRRFQPEVFLVFGHGAG